MNLFLGADNREGWILKKNNLIFFQKLQFPLMKLCEAVQRFDVRFCFRSTLNVFNLPTKSLIHMILFLNKTMTSGKLRYLIKIYTSDRNLCLQANTQFSSHTCDIRPWEQIWSVKHLNLNWYDPLPPKNSIKVRKIETNEHKSTL